MDGGNSRGVDLAAEVGRTAHAGHDGLVQQEQMEGHMLVQRLW